MKPATQPGTTTAPRPQLGDIIIHNLGALVYIGTIERFCTHNVNMVEGPALVVGSDDAKFYECHSSHYFPLSKCKVVGKPPVMPFDDEAVPEAEVGITVLNPQERRSGAERRQTMNPLLRRAFAGRRKGSRRAAAAVAGVDDLIDIPRVLGSAPDEEPF